VGKGQLEDVKPDREAREGERGERTSKRLPAFLRRTMLTLVSLIWVPGCFPADMVAAVAVCDEASQLG